MKTRAVQIRLLPAVCMGLFLIGLLSSVPALAENGSDKPKLVDLWQPGDSGQRMRIRGRVSSLDGRPLPKVVVGIRHADSEGIDWSYFQGEVTTNAKGLYQFGSVVPGNSHRLSHVHVTVDHAGYEYLDTEFHFKHDPKAARDDPAAIFLETATVDDETMMYGRYDITLVPR